jgi:mannose-6-phosphate isomerase-like protein (cupin superfamily)
MEVVDKLLDMSSVQAGDHLFDLGCGDGRIPLRAASRFGCRGTGVECEAKEAAQFREYIARSGLGAQVQCVQGDLREVDLSAASIIVTYLLPDAMMDIAGKLRDAVERGVTVVCNSWGIPDLTATETDACGNTTLLVYRRTPATKRGQVDISSSSSSSISSSSSSSSSSINSSSSSSSINSSSGGKIKARSLAAGFASFSEHWSPRIAGVVNDMHLKLVKVQGDFVWHHHDDEDELFLVIKGRLQMGLRTCAGSVDAMRESGGEDSVGKTEADVNVGMGAKVVERWEVVEAGNFIIVPHGVEHCPRADEECEIILLEPTGTLNTGNMCDDAKTKHNLETIYDA